jgi:hypothetical protein
VALTRPNGRRHQLAAASFVNACERAAVGVSQSASVVRKPSKTAMDRVIAGSLSPVVAASLRWECSDGPSPSGDATHARSDNSGLAQRTTVAGAGQANPGLWIPAVSEANRR